jgi:dienelactone hydrolase
MNYAMPHRTFLFLCLLSIPLGRPNFVFSQESSPIAVVLRDLSADVLSDELGERFKDQTWRLLRARGDVANQRDLATSREVANRADWERLRDERLKRLRMALGVTTALPKNLDFRVTKAIKGDGFVVENLIYESRPGLWVTANLYAPAKPGKKMPGILITHSHHRPKTQGELQDMGMTWARAGCVTLVIDLLGHGERGDHPFRSERDYRKKNSGYRWWRQDYYHRFDLNAQLELVGQSLMGWMVGDLMRGVDLLLARPGIDPNKILLLGAVAGGGDPAGVTAALDRRIDAVVPFNFGGPQPETRYPLPEDAELRFNYLGGAYWESTRNLRRTGVDGFFHWLIVGSVAPRALVYAHEFAWDKERDPVWKRLKKIYGFYDANDKIDYTRGAGSVKGRAPDSTHCTNIGRHHRQRIHLAFKRWFGIDVSPEDEYSMRLESDDLRSMTDLAQKELKPRKLFEVAGDLGKTKVDAARKHLEKQAPAARRRQLRLDWGELLGDVDPRQQAKILSRTNETLADNKIRVERIALESEPGLVVPLVLISRNRAESVPSRVVVAVSQAGKEKFLRERSKEIADLLEGGAIVCLLDVRAAGTSRGSRGEGANGSISYYAQFFETPILGLRLRDLRAVLQYLRSRDDLKVRDFALWGDSFKPANARDTDFQVPRRVSGRPRFSEPMGGLLALLGALFEEDVKSVFIRGGLSGYGDVLSSPYVYVPHDVIVPGVLTKGDLADVAAALPPCRLKLEGMVDGLNRTLSADKVRSLYDCAVKSYQTATPKSLSIANGRSNAASWLLGGE